MVVIQSIGSKLRHSCGQEAGGTELTQRSLLKTPARSRPGGWLGGSRGPDGRRGGEPGDAQFDFAAGSHSELPVISPQTVTSLPAARSSLPAAPTRTFALRISSTLLMVGNNTATGCAALTRRMARSCALRRHGLSLSCHAGVYRMRTPPGGGIAFLTSPASRFAIASRLGSNTPRCCRWDVFSSPKSDRP